MPINERNSRIAIFLASCDAGVNFMRIITPAERLTIELSRPDPAAILNIPRLVSSIRFSFIFGYMFEQAYIYGRLDKRLSMIYTTGRKLKLDRNISV